MSSTIAVYGVLFLRGEGYFSWAIDDIISLDSIRSPTFEFQSFPFHIRLCVHSREDRLQLSVNAEITPTERYQVTLEMGTGIGGQMELRSGRMDSNGDFLVRRWMPWKEVLHRRLEILSNGRLVVTCKLQSEGNILTPRTVTSSEDETASEEGKSSDSHEELGTDIERNFEEGIVDPKDDSDDEDATTLPSNIIELKKALKSLVMNEENSDVTIRVQGKEFPAHRCILGMRSPVFNSMFLHEMSEKRTGFVEIDDCDPVFFQDFLTHLYTGSTRLVNSENVFALYETSDKYRLHELKEACLLFMKFNLTSETFCAAMSLALRHDERELVHLATDFFCVFAQKIVDTKEWQIFLAENSTVGNELFRKALKKKKHET